MDQDPGQHYPPGNSRPLSSGADFPKDADPRRNGRTDGPIDRPTDANLEGANLEGASFGGPERNDTHPQVEQASVPLEPEVLSAIDPEASQLESAGSLDKTFVGALSRSIKERYERLQGELTFDEYLKEVVKDPNKFIRNSSQYTVDMLHHFGFTEKEVLGRNIRDFHLRRRPWESNANPDVTTLVGQELPLFDFYKECQLNSELAHPKRIFIFHGPPGAGKTLLSDIIDEGLEHYSRAEEGARYRLVWYFGKGDNSDSSGNMNYLSELPSGDDVGVDLKSGSRIVPRGNTDPIFLIPGNGASAFEASATSEQASERERFFEHLRKHNMLDEGFNSSYFLSGELDSTSQKIVGALLRYYSGDFSKVLQHARVERWYMSSKLGEGLVSLRPNPDRSADVGQMFPEREFAPKALQSAQHEILDVRGMILGASRGHHNFSDLLRPNERDRGTSDLSRFDYLLETIEGGATQILSRVDPSLVVTEPIDVVLRGNTNDEHIVEKMKGSGWKAFRRRVRSIPVPLIRRFREEERAQQKFLENVLKEKREIAPHAMRSFALFVTATRLLRPVASQYSEVHGELPSLLGDLNVVEKAFLLQEPTKEEPRESLNILRTNVNPLHESDFADRSLLEKQEIDRLVEFMPEIASEFTRGLETMKFSLYDGRLGISTAGAEDFLREIVQELGAGPVTVVEVFKVLERHAAIQFEYYHDMYRARVEYAEQEVNQLEQEQRALGQAFEKQQRQQARQKALEQVNKAYPMPTPDEILDQVKHYAKQKINSDIFDVVKSEGVDNANFVLQRYLAHARVDVSGQGQVPREFRMHTGSSESGADQVIMESFENEMSTEREFETDDERRLFREDVIQQAATWAMRNPGKDLGANLGSIFPTLLEGIRRDQQRSVSEAFKEFVDQTNLYIGHPEVLKSDLAGDEEKQKKAQAWVERKDKFVAKGYPEETVAKHVSWATGGK